MPAYQTRRLGGLSLTPPPIPPGMTRADLGTLIDQTRDRLARMRETREQASGPFEARGYAALPPSSAELTLELRLIALRLAADAMDRSPVADAAHDAAVVHGGA